MRAAHFLTVAAWVSGLPALLRVLVFDEQFILAMVGFATCLVYLDSALKPNRTVVFRLSDISLALVTLGCFAYLAFSISALMMMPIRPPWVLWVSAGIVVLVLEATRRKTGWVLPLLVIALALFFLFIGPKLPEAFQSRPLSLTRVVPYLTLDANALMGRVSVIVGTIVLPFIVFGYLLNAFGGSQFFTGIANRLVGRFRGGPAKVSVVGSASFGMVSGSAVANVVSVGSVSIPMMKRTGYPAHTAAAIEAVTSTGGQLMPPIMGASAFLMAEFLEIPYRDIVIAAILPALFFYLALFLSVDFEARRLNLSSGEQAAQETESSPVRGIVFLIPVIVLLYLLFVERKTPGYASVFTVLTLMSVFIVFAKLGIMDRFKSLVNAVLNSMGAATDIILLGATASFVIGLLHTTGFASAITIQMVLISAGHLALLLLLAGLLSLILGMGMPTVGVYILLALLAAPAIVELGTEPLAAHFYVLYFGMLSMITPPVAIASFTAASVAGTNPWKVSFASLRMGAGTYLVPIAFVTQPELLLLGNPGEILLASFRLTLAIILCTAAATGFSTIRLSSTSRWLLAILSLLNILPFTGAPTDYLLWAAIGIGLMAVYFGFFRGRSGAE